MRFKDVFSIIGPAMIGPSSSHTAGAARIGRVARQMFGALPQQARILFYGSFAATYAGHGTDYAIIGGLLDFATDDPRLRIAFDLAEQYGMSFSFEQGKGLYPHPNTVRLILSDTTAENQLNMLGTSIGGGNIEIVEINGFRVTMTGSYPTLVVCHHDWPGVVADISSFLRLSGVNIGSLSVDRKGRNGDALTVIEVDSQMPRKLVEQLHSLSAVQSVHLVDLQ